MRDEQNYNLLHCNTFGIEVHCKRFIEYSSVIELRELIPILTNERYFHIGGGSNLLFTGDVDLTVLHSGIRDLIPVKAERPGEVWLRVGAGMEWDQFVNFCVTNELYGIENLSGIPGEVGASAVQNIGAYGAEAKDYIRRIEVMDLDTGKTHVLGVEECGYSYRQSNFKTIWKGRFAITSVIYGLSTVFKPQLDYGTISKEIEAQRIKRITPQVLRETIIGIRNQKLPDPKHLGNAGSFFMNPIVPTEKFEELASQYPNMPHYEMENGIKIPAGWMIEQCGWKGRSLGPAAVYDKQALVLVNKGGATGQDIKNLSDAICTDVKERFGIEIHPEVMMIE